MPAENSSWGVLDVEPMAGGDAWITFIQTRYFSTRPPTYISTYRHFRYHASEAALLSEERPAQENLHSDRVWMMARDGRGNELGLGAVGGQQPQPAYLIRPEGGAGPWGTTALPNLSGYLRFFVPTSDGGALVGGWFAGLPMGPTLAVAKLGADYAAPVGLRRPVSRNGAVRAPGLFPGVDALGRIRTGQSGKTFKYGGAGPMK